MFGAEMILQLILPRKAVLAVTLARETVEALHFRLMLLHVALQVWNAARQYTAVRAAIFASDGISGETGAQRVVDDGAALEGEGVVDVERCRTVLNG